MKIDYTIDIDDISDIDNSAYELYIEECCDKEQIKKFYISSSFISIEFFIYYKGSFSEYYDKAKNHLRKNKLEKLNIL